MKLNLEKMEALLVGSSSVLGRACRTEAGWGCTHSQGLLFGSTPGSGSASGCSYSSCSQEYTFSASAGAPEVSLLRYEGPYYGYP